MSAGTVTEREVEVTAGRLHVRQHGDGGTGPLVLCIPGLSANAVSFDVLGEALADDGRRLAAVDLRGRGRSAVTAPGTYGWAAHARDVLELATALGGGDAVDLVGHSMGAYVAMAASAAAGDAVRRIVLVDGLGRPESASLPPILASVDRLGTVWPSREAYLERARSLGAIAPWSERWERYFAYELDDVDGGVMARTSRAAVEEDIVWGVDHPQDGLWAGIRHPVLLVRATEPLGDTGGFIVRPDDVALFLTTVPDASTVDVPASHYGVVMHTATVAAVRRFLAP